MQVTKELIENDIKGMKSQIEQLKASLAQSQGALSVLENIVSYMDKEEPVPEAPKDEISDANKEVQDNLEAMSLQELAEAVGGPGAIAEIEAIEPAPKPSRKK